MRDKVFGEGERTAQARWGNPNLWTEARIAELVWDRIPEMHHARIEAAPFFFLATSDREGRCDCAFKGGGPGLVRVLSPKCLSFPHFPARVPGNGAYLSLGNILVNPAVSLLFVDFNDGARLRVNGRASVHEDGAMKSLDPRAECVIEVDIEQVVPACRSYVPRLVPA